MARPDAHSLSAIDNAPGWTANPMTEELIFYTHPMSRGRTVRWMLEEIGTPYRTEILEYGPAMKHPEYLKVNPMGKVPAIVHGDRIVTEAAAICAYLADAFPDAGLAPPLGERDRYYRWLFFLAGPGEAAISNRMFGFTVPPDRERTIGYGTFEDVMDAMERAVSETEYIAGDAFSAADVYCGMQIGWGLRFESIEARPAFEAYWSKLADRPALKRAEQIDDALLPDEPPAQ
jgi:glutathione S-transferase